MASYDDTSTVSGSVVSFPNGADDVPTKSLVVTIPATLDGVSSVTETQTGRNLFDKTTATIGKYINVNGQEATNEIKAHSVLLPLKPSTSYYMSGYAYGSYYSILALDKDMNVLSTWYGGASKTEPFVATTPNNARWCYLNFNADQIDTVIFAESATAISYEAYNGTVSTVNLGRTIYGGTADIVNGTGTDENGNDFTFTGQEITTRLGYNAFWSEQGNTELTYYKSGYGFTSVTVHKETPDGEPVEQTAKLHKVIYGGTANVVKGTCEPKNLFVKDNPNEVDGYFTTTGFSTGNANAKTVYIPIVGGETYTVSKTAGQRFQIATAEVIPSNGAVFTGRQANNTATSLTITASANDKYLWAWVFLDGTDTGTLSDMLDSVQIEKGSSATEYAPGFTPFSFPPISMETDEGENTLFANEGSSAITYRKETD